MVYILVAVALGLAFASYVKTIELEERIKRIENKMRWWI
jgi:hypothetical protein